MERVLSPELLDLLPPNDLRARRSRRDLRRINRFMGNDVWWRKTVAPKVDPADRVLEVGAGDNCSLNLPGRHIDGLDQHEAPEAWPRQARWHRKPLQTFEGWPEYDGVIGNLIFHHFTEAELRELGARMIPHLRFIVACEPVRARRYQWGFLVLARLLAASEVTRHDGYVSVRAGFRWDELPNSLGLDPGAWQWTVRQTWRGAYRMMAVKRA